MQMKTIVPIFAACLFFSIGCAEDDECKYCSILTTDERTGKESFNTESEKEFCGTELETIENKEAITLDSVTSKWVCE